MVDDQRFVGMALTHLLAAEADLRLHCCLDAEAAIDRANEIAPELILQDLVMPKLDGLTLVRMFRDNPTTAHTPVIVLSGNDDAETREGALAAGASDYLVKIPPQAALVSCLRRHLAGHAVGAAGAPPIRQVAVIDEPLDLSVIAEFQNASDGGASGFVATLLDGFMQEMTAQVDALGTASRRQDAAALKAAAHRLKGGAATIGAKPLAALCARLEHELGRPAPIVTAIDLVVAVTDEAGRVRAACVRERERIELRA